MKQTGKMDQEPWLLRNVEGVLVGVIVVALVVAAIPLALYLVHFFGLPLSDDNSIWGSFGSYVSGTLGSVLNFFALAALALTLWFQSVTFRQNAKALEAERRSSADRDFERAFFELLRLYSDIVRSIDLRKPLTSQITAQGRDCFKTFYSRLGAAYKKMRKPYEFDPLKLTADTVNGQTSPPNARPPESELLRAAYREFFGDNQHEIGHYFRTLYRIFKFLNDSDRPEETKRSYAGIVRAQLSTYEAALLFYNCLADVGEKFKPYVEQYALLENLDTTELIDEAEHKSLYQPSAFGTVNL